MGGKTFIHYSFPTHMAKEVLPKRRDMMKETCDRIGLQFVSLNTPDPKTSAESMPMLQFLQEDIPRQIAKYGKDTCIFGTNCPMQDVIIAKALELKFIMAEQCCPTPTQGFPAAMNLEITEKDAGNFDKINAMITKNAAAGCTGRLSTWPVPVGYFFPEFSTEVAMQMSDGKLDDVSMASLAPLAKDVAGVYVFFEKMLELKNISKSYGCFPVLKSDSLKVDPGKINALVGMNGSGKRTLLNFLSSQKIIHEIGGFSGEIWLEKEKRCFTSPQQAILSGVGMVHQEDRRTDGLLLDHSIMDNMTFTAIHTHKKYVKKTWLPFLNLPDKKKCKAYADTHIKSLDIHCRSPFQKENELSGGNQQKVCIAAALSLQPDILFVNDPTRGIDISAKESILSLLIRAHQLNGLTLIVSSGEIDELKRICDRIVVLYKGRLFDIFSPDRDENDFVLACSGISPGKS